MTRQVPPTSAVRRAVHRRRLSDEVAGTLREMILLGELLPDRRVTQEELAHELGVSTTPVREALMRLATEGFVRVSPNRAFTVVAATREDVRDVFWMHALLLAELTRRACLRTDDGLLTVVRRHGEDYAEAVRRNDVEAMETSNWGFHRAINLAANAPRLRLALATTLRFIPGGLYGLLPAWGATAVHGHEQILSALEQGDPEAGAAAADAHVRHAEKTVSRFFTSTGYWTRSADADLPQR